MTELQLRLKTAELDEQIRKNTDGLTDDESTVVEIRMREAFIANQEEIINKLKKGLRERTEAGEKVGSDQVGYYVGQPSKPRETFDAQKAMELGFLSKQGDWAQCWITKEQKPSLVFKAPTQKEN